MEKYSYSKINRFYECPFSYYENYFKKNRCGISHGTSEFGTFIHSILEKYAKGELKLSELVGYYETNYESQVVADFTLKLSEDFSKNYGHNYYYAGIQYLSSFEGFGDFEILDVEYAFEIDVKGLFIFNGVIDLVVKDKNGDIIIIDHKSKSKFKSKKEKSLYTRQLYLYAGAIFDKYGVYPKTLTFNMFRIGEWVDIEFNIDEYEKTVSWAIVSVHEIEECMEYPSVDKTFFCNNFCNYRNMRSEIGCSSLHGMVN